ncbi:alpha-amylase family glycosyl hydrolase [Flavobacterium sp. RHBU_24]|uniref:alpha-amylase family glycosyl hydrolase n=1 Tax=Flavobacterium sp. RHBU_24 TaxID=3391185 RepID=UPI0039850696
MLRLIILLFCILFVNQAQAQKEVIYHVFQRSFFDSNADQHGDLEGIRQKLDYLQQTGVTSIMLTPLYTSDFYHNYFATDFEKIDPKYGSFKEYRDLVQEVHRRGMKIYQDVEMQYVVGKHPWFTDSYQNPKSGYSQYIFYDDTANKKPWYFFNAPEFTIYDGSTQQIAIVNMKSKAVKDYTLKVLKYWADPNGDGDFYDGVDGYRLDHMMDDLDNAGKLTHLFRDFWVPLLADLKKVNPKLIITAEQANWGSYGYEYFSKGTVDRVFAFRLQAAISSFNKEAIIKAADSTFNYLPKGKDQVVFIENHDTKRFASVSGGNIDKERVGAALNILLGGIPSIYYGQEIGMKGEQLKGPTDGNDIAIREAFDWYKSGDGKGMANWYKDTGIWWDNRNNRPDDGISLEEETSDPMSLYNFYKTLLHIRRMENAFEDTRFTNLPNANPNVLTFIKRANRRPVLVMVNLGDKEETVTVEDGNALHLTAVKLLAGYDNVKFPKGGKTLVLPPYAIQVWRLLLD